MSVGDDDNKSKKNKRRGVFVWLAEHPTLILSAGLLSPFIFFFISYVTNEWGWFPRGGALMALCGFIVSVEEALLYVPPQSAVYEEPIRNMASGSGYGIRSGPYGLPVMHPNQPFTKNPDDMDQEERDAYNEAVKIYDESEPLGGDSGYNNEEPELIREAHGGRPMRNLSDMTDTEYSRLRLSAILGVFGTVIWAFGDLIGNI